MNRFAVAVLLLAWAPLAAASELDGRPDAEGYTLRLELRRWSPSLGAQIQKNFSEGFGTLIDVPADLGVTDHSTFQVRGILQLGYGHRIRVSYTRLDYDGDREVDRQIRFGGTVYDISTRVVTTASNDYYTADYEWDIVKGTNGYVGPIIGVKFLNAVTTLVAPDLGDRKAEAVHVPVPVLGVAGRLYAGQASVYGEISGLTIGEKGHMFELDLGGHVDLVPHVGVEAGYRRLTVYGNDSDGLIDFKLGGLHFGADVSF